MIEIKEVKEKGLKAEVADKILHALPDWFGIISDKQKYVEESSKLPCFAVFDNGVPIGFLAVKAHNEIHAELFLMGVLEQYHRTSIGRGLFNTFQNYCIKQGFRYISVKTVDYSSDNEYYVKTRKFYRAMGFVPFEMLRALWSERNPCLLMIKDLEDADNSYKCRSSNNE